MNKKELEVEIARITKDLQEILDKLDELIESLPRKPMGIVDLDG